jgi:hypothetical protein
MHSFAANWGELGGKRLCENSISRPAQQDSLGYFLRQPASKFGWAAK